MLNFLIVVTVGMAIIGLLGIVAWWIARPSQTYIDYVKHIDKLKKERTNAN